MSMLSPSPVLFALNIAGALALAWILWGYFHAPKTAAYVFLVFMAMIIHAFRLETR